MLANKVCCAIYHTIHPLSLTFALAPGRVQCDGLDACVDSAGSHTFAAASHNQHCIGIPLMLRAHYRCLDRLPVHTADAKSGDMLAMECPAGRHVVVEQAGIRSIQSNREMLDVTAAINAACRQYEKDASSLPRMCNYLFMLDQHLEITDDKYGHVGESFMLVSSFHCENNNKVNASSREELLEAATKAMQVPLYANKYDTPGVMEEVEEEQEHPTTWFTW